MLNFSFLLIRVKDLFELFHEVEVFSRQIEIFPDGEGFFKGLTLELSSQELKFFCDN